MGVTDRETAGLRGQVIVCVTNEVQRGFSQTERFELDGKLTERRIRNPDGSENTMTRRYGAQGKLEMEEWSSPARTHRYAYDSDSRLIRVDEELPDGSSRPVESWHYHGDGTSRMTVYHDPSLAGEGVSVSNTFHAPYGGPCRDYQGHSGSARQAS